VSDVFYDVMYLDEKPQRARHWKNAFQAVLLPRTEGNISNSTFLIQPRALSQCWNRMRCRNKSVIVTWLAVAHETPSHKAMMRA